MSDVCRVEAGLYPVSTNASLSLPTSPGRRGRGAPVRSAASRAFSEASCSLKKAFVPSAAGRSNDVAVPLVHVPCRSGWPSGVLSAATVDAFDTAGRVWATIETEPNTARISPANQGPAGRPTLDIIGKYCRRSAVRVCATRAEVAEPRTRAEIRVPPAARLGVENPMRYATLFTAMILGGVMQGPA